MTMISLSYKKSTEYADPQICVGLHIPTFFLLKILLYRLFGHTTLVWQTFSILEIETISKMIIRYNFVKNFRSHLKR